MLKSQSDIQYQVILLKSQLPANHLRVELRPAVVTDRAPLACVIDLQAALVAALPACQPHRTICARSKGKQKQGSLFLRSHGSSEAKSVTLPLLHPVWVCASANFRSFFQSCELCLCPVFSCGDWWLEYLWEVCRKQQHLLYGHSCVLARGFLGTVLLRVHFLCTVLHPAARGQSLLQSKPGSMPWQHPCRNARSTQSKGSKLKIFLSCAFDF